MHVCQSADSVLFLNLLFSNGTNATPAGRKVSEDFKDLEPFCIC
jgi:hypothetical protein